MANLPDPYNWLAPITTVIATGLGMMGLTVAKRHDLAEAARSYGLLKVAEVDPTTTARRHEDVRRHQCADRRPNDRLVASGFLWGTLVVPRFVVAELQQIADAARPGTSRHAAGAASRCFPCLRRIRASRSSSTTRTLPDVEAVDAKLLSLARAEGAGILTNDYNLNRVAQLDDVRVLEPQPARPTRSSPRSCPATRCASRSSSRARSPARDWHIWTMAR